MMKKILILSVWSFVFLTASGEAQDLLSSKFTKNELAEVLIPQQQWVPFPALSDRQKWAKADQKMMQAYVKQAEAYLNYQWPSMAATKSLLIKRTGDRNEYEKESFEKRQVLGTLLLAEIHENQGRFIDQIINGVWSICEESFWGVPAHLPKTEEYSGLMDVSQPFVDLFAAETATFLAWVDYFVGEKLDAVSPQIRKRIYYETNNRIFQPLMTQHHGFMGPNSNGRPPNNWNPWICSNWLNAALLLEKDDARRTDMVFKILEVLDEFVNPYPMDGGCDEGPGYWGAAAASLFDNVSLLNLASNDAFRYVYQDEKIRNMGKFIYRAQISQDYFLNFADADPQPNIPGSMVYRFGKAIEDPDMMHFGSYYREPEDGVIKRFHYFRNLFALFMQEEFRSAPQALPLPQDVWLPDLQVMIARDQPGSSDGWFVAVKGGHNDESHNHNDIGNYIVYYDGLPLLIDVGRGTYTRKTFSDQRYEIWYNRSDYHNVPTINGETQPPGSNFKATNVTYDQGKTFAQFALDISTAYPEQAGVNRWQRTVRLNRGQQVEINDVIDLEKADSFTEHLMTCYPAEVVKPGELVIHYQHQNGQSQDFIMHYDAKKLQATVEKVPLTTMEDQGIKQKWGDTIHRINFLAKNPKAKERFTFRVSVR